MRERINQAMKTALKAGAKQRLATLRLILAAIKDRELGIGAGGVDAAHGPLSDSEVMGMLQKMIKQRRDSIETYRQGNRPDLVEQEQAEIKVIEEFLPQQMDEEATRAAISQVISELGASGLKDMGRTMAALKAKYPGEMDFAAASAVVKEMLNK